MMDIWESYVALFNCLFQISTREVPECPGNLKLYLNRIEGVIKCNQHEFGSLFVGFCNQISAYPAPVDTVFVYFDKQITQKIIQKKFNYGRDFSRSFLS